MTEDDEPKRRGRPAIASEDRKNNNLTFRTRGDLRSQLEEAAKQTGRSISEEIEHRLHQSFDRKSVALQIYGKSNTDLIEALCWILGAHQSTSGRADTSLYLAAITTLLAVSGSDLENLIAMNADPSVWTYLSEVGISRACGIDLFEASKMADRLFPEMANRMAEYRAGAEMARRVKKAKEA